MAPALAILSNFCKPTWTYQMIANVNISGFAARFYEQRYLAMPPMMTHLARIVIQTNPEVNLLLY
jgi:hypothetical protein